MRLTGNCRMTNHFLVLLWPHEEGGLSRWMLWLMTSYVRRYDRHSKGSGHVCPVRFKGFPVQSDEHDLMVLRYQERNPLRQRCEAFFIPVETVSPNSQRRHSILDDRQECLLLRSARLRSPARFQYPVSTDDLRILLSILVCRSR